MIDDAHDMNEYQIKDNEYLQEKKKKRERIISLSISLKKLAFHILILFRLFYIFFF